MKIINQRYFMARFTICCSIQKCQKDGQKNGIQICKPDQDPANRPGIVHLRVNDIRYASRPGIDVKSIVRLAIWLTITHLGPLLIAGMNSKIIKRRRLFARLSKS